MKYVEPNWNSPEIAIGDLRGKTLLEVEVSRGKDRIVFRCADGSLWLMYHDQDCCESVYVESITGDLDDLIGHPLLLAEETISSEAPPEVSLSYQPDSQTWTFYKLATIKGYVDIRWFGESNGYYGESVSVVRVEPVEEQQ